MAAKTKAAKAAPKSTSAKSTSAKSVSAKSVSAKPVGKKTVSKSKSKSKLKPMSLSHDEIARQAYMLWLERGGSEMDNWLEAEKNLH